MENLVFNVAKQFSKTPGPRLKSEGNYSAEQLLEEHLIGLVKSAQQNSVKLIVELDGTLGYATSFLEGTFGELARIFGIESILNTIEIISKESSLYKEEALSFIKQANDR